MLKEDLIPGFRIIKTTLAVFICIALFDIIGYTEVSINASIATVLTVRQSMEETSQYGFDRVLGTILGGIVSFIVLWLPLENIYQPLVLSLAMMFSLMIAKWFHLRGPVYSMSAVVLLVTLLSHGSSNADALQYVTARVIESIVGIVIALLVNRFVRPDLLRKGN